MLLTVVVVLLLSLLCGLWSLLSHRCPAHISCLPACLPASAEDAQFFVAFKVPLDERYDDQVGGLPAFAFAFLLRTLRF